MKKLIALAVVLYVCSLASAQFGVSYHVSQNFSKVGVSYDFNSQWRINAGLYGSDFSLYYPVTVDAAVTYNLLNSEKYDMYIGVGGILNKSFTYYDISNFYLTSYDGLMVPAGVAIKPLKEFAGFSILIEAIPVYSFTYGDVFIYGSAGMRYVFGKKE